MIPRILFRFPHWLRSRGQQRRARRLRPGAVRANAKRQLAVIFMRCNGGAGGKLVPRRPASPKQHFLRVNGCFQSCKNNVIRRTRRCLRRFSTAEARGRFLDRILLRWMHGRSCADTGVFLFDFRPCVTAFFHRQNPILNRLACISFFAHTR